MSAGKILVVLKMLRECFKSATQLVLIAHKEAVNSLSGNGSAILGAVAAVVASANSMALESTKEIEAAMKISMRAALGMVTNRINEGPMDDLSIMKETLRVKDEELQQLARDLRARDSTIKEIAEKLTDTAEAAEAVASAAHAMDEQRRFACAKIVRLTNESKKQLESSMLKVLASKTKIYMVLEYVAGGELFDRIANKGRLPEDKGRKLFHQLIDTISYCHDKGVYHRDLKPKNVLIDKIRNIKISDFGLSALHHFRITDYCIQLAEAPIMLPQRFLPIEGMMLPHLISGLVVSFYMWFFQAICLLMIGTLQLSIRRHYLLLLKIFKGDVKIPKWLSHGAQNMIKRCLLPIKRL